MNRAVLLQLKKTVKQVEEGTAIAVGKKVTTVIPFGESIEHKKSLEFMCLTRVVALLHTVNDESFEKVREQFAYVPSEIKLKLLQYMIIRRELTPLASLALLSNLSFSSLIIPRNQKLNDNWAYNISLLASNLQVLDVRGCGEVSMKGIQHIVSSCGPNLVYLDISGRNRDSDGLIEILKSTPKLKFLGFRDTDTNVNGLETAIPQYCPQLQHLELSYNRGFSFDFIFKLVHNLPLLSWLDFSWCLGVTDEGVGEIAKTIGDKLNALNVEMCCRNGIHVTDVGIMEVAKNCPNLEHLSVNLLKFVSDASIVAISKNCPQLKSLHLSGCEISDVSLEAIAEHCKYIENCSLSGLTEITDTAVLSLLNKCENLSLVDISNCRQISAEVKQKFGTKLFSTHQETGANCIFYYFFFVFLIFVFCFIIIFLFFIF